MTPQPQQEYLITDDKIRTSCDIAGIPAPDEEHDTIFFETIHKLSRPAPSHLESDDRGWEQGFQDGQTSALVDLNVYATTIRNQTLDEATENISNFDNHNMTRGEAIRILESLRRSPEAHQ